MISLGDWMAETGYSLKQMLDASLETGSPTAILIVFAAGLLTSFTPCVYPMIPVTVSFMGTASGGNRRLAVVLSLIYVSGMALVYAALGVISALIGETFGNFTRSPWVYGGVALVMVLLGLAMLDKLPIPVPGFVTRVQSEGTRRSGWLGALLMGIAAGFVAAPCTAPVLGALLIYVGRTRDVLWGGTLMVAFAFGLGALLLVLGIFSGILTGLPRAGAWMVRVKWFFGIGMFLVAAYFLWVAIRIGVG